MSVTSINNTIGFSRLKNVFRHGINYAAASTMAQSAKNQLVGNLPADLINAIIKGNPNNKKECIKQVQNAFVDTACLLQQCEKLEIQGMRRRRISLDNAVNILDRLKNGKTDFYRDKIFDEKITELTLKAEEGLIKKLKVVLPDVHNVKLTFIDNGAYGDAFKLEVLNKQGQKLIADNVIKTFKSNDAQSKLMLETVNRLFSNYSIDDLANAARKMGKKLNEESILSIKNQIKEISNSLNEASCLAARRMHGSFAEANTTEYIRTFSGHKLGEAQGLVLPDMFYLGDTQFSLSKFIDSSSKAIREFDFQRLGLRLTDINTTNRINGICFDIGGIVPYLKLSKLKSFDINSSIAGNKTSIRILKRLYNTQPEQREQLLDVINKESEQCKNILERQNIQKALKEIKDNYCLTKTKTKETEILRAEIPANILNELDRLM